MKKCFYAVLLVCVSGCVSVPQKIDELLLSEKTPQQGAKINELEDKIINQNKNVASSEMKLTASSKRLSKEQGTLSVLDKEKALCEEKLKVAKAAESEVEISSAQDELEKNGVKINLQKLKVDYFTALKRYDTASSNYEASKLNTLVAELDYEKAKIARAYQDKQADEKKKTSLKEEEEESMIDNIFGKNDGMIDVEHYRKFYESQKAAEEKASAAKRNAAADLEKSEAALPGAVKKEEL